MDPRVAQLSRSPLFDMLSNQELEVVASLSHAVRLEAGQLLFEEGDLGDALFVIVSGELDVVCGDRQAAARVIAELEAPEFFGEMGVLEKGYRSATVRARTAAELLRLSAEDLTDFRERFPDGFTYVVMNIARVLSARLREADTRLGPLPSRAG